MLENQLPSALINEIQAFWQQGSFLHFNVLDNTRINYAHFIHLNQHKPCVVIVSGRSEAYLKYQELSYDLYNQGYDIFLVDHRGQGLSERLLINTNKGYVADFTDYENDLKYFIDNIVSDTHACKPYLLAHSMGGVIATRYMQRFPNSIQAAVLSAPMMGFNSGSIPAFIAKNLLSFSHKVNLLFSDEPWYFLGQGDYQVVPFHQNKLTHSQIRYQHFTNLYESFEQIKLGGVTIHWLLEGIKAQDKIFSQLPLLKTPILVLQAEKDSIVANQAQNDFCRQLHKLKPKSYPNSAPVLVKDSYHELLFECDPVREFSLKQILAWFSENPP